MPAVQYQFWRCHHRKIKLPGFDQRPTSLTPSVQWCAYISILLITWRFNIASGTCVRLSWWKLWPLIFWSPEFKQISIKSSNHNQKVVERCPSTKRIKSEQSQLTYSLATSERGVIIILETVLKAGDFSHWLAYSLLVITLWLYSKQDLKCKVK